MWSLKGSGWCDRRRFDRGVGVACGAAGHGRLGAWAGGVALAEAVDAPGQGAGGVAGLVEGALAEGLVEKGGGVVAGGFGVGEDSGEGVPGEGVPGGVFQDAVGVLGGGLLEVAGVAVCGLGAGVRRAMPSRTGTATWA